MNNKTRHSYMPANWRLGLPPPLGPQVEDPVRIHELCERLGKLSWEKNSQATSLEVVFEEIGRLTQAELRHYFTRRRRSRRTSLICRTLAWFAATSGLLLPLVAPVLTAPPANLLSWGYIAFAIAAAALLFDNVFAGTHAHQRSAKHQLDIEGLYAIFVLQWQGLRSAWENDRTPERLADLLTATVEFAKAMHLSIGAETSAWSDAVNVGLTKLEKALPAHGSTPAA